MSLLVFEFASVKMYWTQLSSFLEIKAEMKITSADNSVEIAEQLQKNYFKTIKNKSFYFVEE